MVMRRLSTLTLAVLLCTSLWKTPAHADPPLIPEGEVTTSFNHDSAHLRELRRHRHSPTEVRNPRSSPVVTPVERHNRTTLGGQDLIIYGYLPYWKFNADIPWSGLTHVAWFSMEVNASGDLINDHGWGNSNQLALRDEAYANGVRFDLVITQFHSPTLQSLLVNPQNRANFVQNITQAVQEGDADGVNIDFERLPIEAKASFVSLVLELRAALDEIDPDLEISLAMPPVDWDGSYDYDLLAAASNFLFLMCYNYHYTGGNPGPNAPIHSDGPFGGHNISFTIDDYIEWGGGEAVLDKLVVGLPSYGQDWPTTNGTIPGTATGAGKAVSYSAARNDPGMNAFSTEPITGEKYRTYMEEGSWRQTFIDDGETLAAKVSYSLERGVRGYGFWAIGYDANHPAFWGPIWQAVEESLPDVEPPPIPDVVSSPDISSPDISSPDISSPDISVDDTGEDLSDPGVPTPDIAFPKDEGSPPSEDMGQPVPVGSGGCTAGRNSGGSGELIWISLIVLGLFRTRRRISPG
jgi:spore germination protein YaaH